ncbi:MAG: hypothetical protein JOZ73_11315 [Solirubrobacterales bacterium]|nr:hypothetical protein [Solirubrobacterales bacterium]
MLVAALVIAAVSGWAYSAFGAGGVINACAKKKGGALRIAKKCKKKERKVSWNQQGPAGQNGKNGTNGTNGATNVVARRGTPASFSGNGTILTASCIGNERAVGGGLIADNTHVTTIDSTPMAGGGPAADGSTPTGWWLDAKTDDATTHSATPIVVCASP